VESQIPGLAEKSEENPGLAHPFGDFSFLVIFWIYYYYFVGW